MSMAKSDERSALKISRMLNGTTSDVPTVRLGESQIGDLALSGLTRPMLSSIVHSGS